MSNLVCRIIVYHQLEEEEENCSFSFINRMPEINEINKQLSEEEGVVDIHQSYSFVFLIDL